MTCQTSASSPNSTKIRLWNSTPDLVGPSITNNQGIIGEGYRTHPGSSGEYPHPDYRVRSLPGTSSETQFHETGQPPKAHLFPQARKIVRRWLDEGYLTCVGNTYPAQTLYREIARYGRRTNQGRHQRRDATGRFRRRRTHQGDTRPVQPTGSTGFVNFTTSRTNLWHTGQDRLPRQHGRLRQQLGKPNSAASSSGTPKSWRTSRITDWGLKFPTPWGGGHQNLHPGLHNPD